MSVGISSRVGQMAILFTSTPQEFGVLIYLLNGSFKVGEWLVVGTKASIGRATTAHGGQSHGAH